MKRFVAAALVALAVGPSAAAACAKPRASLTSLEGQVMCLTCHATLDQSDSSFANRIRAYMRTRIAACATEGQIKQELVDQFGPSILAAPPRKGFDLLAWWLPIGGVVAGALLVALGVWRWTRAREPEPVEAPPADPETERQLDELLARLD